mgnify:CR=1 FL=1
MRAIIVGTPLQIEGEPAAIAQLALLLMDGSVVVEHAHHWQIPAEHDGNGVYTATCWCGQTRMMAPYDALDRARSTGTNATLGLATSSYDPVKAEAAAARRGGRRRGPYGCRGCGVVGHRKAQCPERAAAS